MLLKLFCHNTTKKKKKKASSNGKITCPNNTVASHCILVCCLHPFPSQKLSSWNKQSADLLLGWGIFFWRLHSLVFTNCKLRRKQGVRSGDFFFFPSQDFRKAMPSQPAGSGKALLKLAAATGKQAYSLWAFTAHPKALHPPAEPLKRPLPPRLFFGSLSAHAWHNLALSSSQA